MIAIDIGVRTDGIQPIDNLEMYKIKVRETPKDVSFLMKTTSL